MDGYFTRPVTSVTLQAAFERWISFRPGDAGATAEDGVLAVGAMVEIFLVSSAERIDVLGEALRPRDLEQFVVGGRIEDAEVRCEDVASAMEVASRALTAARRAQA